MNRVIDDTALQCQNCKHWTPNKPDDEPVGPSWGRCALAKSSNGGPVAFTMAFAEDSESYGAWLTTRDSFGCVQFTEKGQS
jgi:hypothetical protein